MVFCVSTYQRCEVKIKQCKNSPVHSDTFRKAAMGNAHAALLREVEKQPFYTLLLSLPSLTKLHFSSYPHLETTSTGENHIRLSEPSTLLASELHQLKQEIVVPLKHALNTLGCSGWTWSSSPSFLNKEGSNLILPFWKGVLNWQIFMHPPLSFHLPETEPPTHSAQPAHTTPTKVCLSHGCECCSWTYPPASPNPAGGSACLHFLGKKEQSSKR